jgi:glycerol uptake facilitator-like aquaporin
MLIEHLLCSGKNAATEVGWSFLWVIFFGLVAAGIAGYAVYKYRIRVIYERPVKVFSLWIIC